jgi:hypothetical protein
VITLGQINSDNINRMITLTDDTKLVNLQLFLIQISRQKEEYFFVTRDEKFPKYEEQLFPIHFLQFYCNEITK